MAIATDRPPLQGLDRLTFDQIRASGPFGAKRIDLIAGDEVLARLARLGYIRRAQAAITRYVAM